MAPIKKNAETSASTKANSVRDHRKLVKSQNEQEYLQALVHIKQKYIIICYLYHTGKMAKKFRVRKSYYLDLI